MPIKIVRIIDRLNVGGPSKQMVWLTSGLEQARFQATLITGSCARGETDMSYLAHKAGIELLSIPSMSREISLRDLLVLGRLFRELVRLKPDIVDTHKSKAGALGRTAALAYKWLTPSALRLRPRRCKVVHTFHGHIFQNYYGPLRTAVHVAIERLLAWLATDSIVVLSESQRREILERFRIGRPEQFRVIPLGLDLGELPQAERPRIRREFEVAADELLIGSVGRLTEIKNHSMLLESVARLLRQGIRGRLVIVGDGHLRERLEERARELGIAQFVRFTGLRRDVLALYPAFDIVALTSLNEGTPMTLIEAMASRRAVAVSEVGGVPDLLGVRQFRQEGFSIWERGVSAQSGDIAGFAQALAFLAAHSGLRAEMGARGRRFVEGNCSRERFLRDTADLYTALCPEAATDDQATPAKSPSFEEAQALSLDQAQ